MRPSAASSRPEPTGARAPHGGASPSKSAEDGGGSVAASGAPDVPPSVNVFRFSLAGLVVFSLALMGGASYVTFRVVATERRNAQAPVVAEEKMAGVVVRAGPWGELLERNIFLQRPAEYLTAEVTDPKPPVWTFRGLKPAAVRALLQQAGLTEGQADAAFASGRAVEGEAGTDLEPSADFVLSLGPDARRRLYGALSGRGVNAYIDYPYIFPRDSLESVYADARLDIEDIATLKRLTYPVGDGEQLSDYQTLLRRIPTVERRLALASSLSRESAVLARLFVDPDTDVEKLAEYWSRMPGVRFTDTRPLLESLRQQPGGGSMSLLYLLPRFARERLYTFPLPPRAGDPVMDCHWSTFNFSSETPDRRFNDPAFLSEVVNRDYYPISTPSQYGDVVLLVDGAGRMKHSAVFIADDIVFTKNGSSTAQPWMLMHVPDLLATYPASPPLKVAYLRNRAN